MSKFFVSMAKKVDGKYTGPVVEEVVDPEAINPPPAPLFNSHGEADDYAQREFPEFVASEKARLADPSSADKAYLKWLAEWIG